jgi:hypothetical protein
VRPHLQNNQNNNWRCGSSGRTPIPLKKEIKIFVCILKDRISDKYNVGRKGKSCFLSNLEMLG